MESEDLCAVAIEAAVAGAKAIQAVGVKDLRAQRKIGVEDYVTTADLASERAIIQVIKMRRPRDTIVAEETGIYPGSSAIQWYVDPLDGTSNILAGSADYAVCVAAEWGGQTVAAAIYRPADNQWLASAPNRRVTGTFGHGLAPARPLDQARITVSRPHDPVRRLEAMKLREALLPHVADEHRVGSAACALLRVATGQLDAYISVDLPLWDTAAGHHFVESAGGVVLRTHSKVGTPLCVASRHTIAIELATILTA